MEAIKDKTEIYLDLFKLSGEEIKEIEILSGDQIEEIDYWTYLFWNGSGWDQCEMSIVIDLELTEISLSEFRQLFSKGEEVLQVENKTFENYERPSLIDLQKVSVCRDKILELIFSTNIHEDIIESLLRPFETLLESNGVNLQETDY